jgi:hypothetical protein
VVVTPIWLTQPYAPPAAPTTKPLLAKLRATARRSVVRVTFTAARRTAVRVAVGRVKKGRFVALATARVTTKPGVNRVSLRPAKLPARYVVRITARRPRVVLTAISRRR